MDLDAYFARIGYGGATVPDLEVLTAIIAPQISVVQKKISAARRANSKRLSGIQPVQSPLCATMARTASSGMRPERSSPETRPCRSGLSLVWG